MMIKNLFIGWLLLLFSEDIHFQSKGLKDLSLTEGSFTGFYIIDDYGDSVGLTGRQGDEGYLYWYRRLSTPVCLTGECKRIDIGIYWNCSGDFQGLEVYGEHLTRTNHNSFSQADYDKLISELENDWSVLREYELTGLLEPAEKVDGVTGATKKEIANAAVDQAVYTTYTIWHLVHVGEKEQIKHLTISQLNIDPHLVKSIATGQNRDYHFFLLEQLEMNKIQPSSITDSLILAGMRSEDYEYKQRAFNSMKFSDISNNAIQENLGAVYVEANFTEKVRILKVLEESDVIRPELCQAIATNILEKNDWFVIRVLHVLSNCSSLPETIINDLEILVKSQNENVRNAAKQVLEYQE